MLFRSAKASRSIDNYVKKLQTTAATSGKSARETELFTLALRGASKAQLDAADSALRLSEGYERGAALGAQLRVGFIALAAAAAAAAVGVVAGTVALIGQVGKYQDLAEKIGDSAVNVSSLKTASDVAGTSLETIASASVKLTAALSKTDDESALVGSAIESLGLDFRKFKALSPVEQLQAVAQAMDGFADGSEKTAIAVGIFGKSGAELLSFLKEYATQGIAAAYITDEQAKAADDYADSQARLKSQIEQFLQVSAVNAIPILVQIGDLFSTIAKEQDGTTSATALVKSAINGLVTVLQTLLVVGSDVGFVFVQLGKDLGTIYNGYAAILRLDFKGFSALGDAAVKDAARARAELDKFQASVMAIGQPSTKFVDPRILGNPGTIAEQARANRPQLDITGLSRDKAPKGSAAGKKDNTAAQEAKAQLAFDIDQIRKAQDALSNTIGNFEKVSEAKRAAGLISEAAYYASKRDLLVENDRVQEAAVEKEIARMQREVLTGKDRIDNDRKIADAQAKLAKLRENASSNLQVLSIREQAALDEIARAFTDARIAAQSYLDVTERARRLDLDGMGKGSKARDFNAAQSQITDKYEQQRQDLQRDNRNGKFAGREADFDRELATINEFQGKALASYTRYYADLQAKQADFSAGASEALNNYIDETLNSFNMIEGAVTRAFQGMEDALVNFVTTGKLDVKSLAKSIISDLARIAIKQSITGPLAQAHGFGGGSGGSGGGSLFDTIGSFLGIGGKGGGSGGGGLFNTIGSFFGFGGGRAIGGAGVGQQHVPRQRARA